jgi:hypothetical protein
MQKSTVGSKELYEANSNEKGQPGAHISFLRRVSERVQPL